MKALTIWQPWASLIVTGAKPFEFRSWMAPRSVTGKEIVIHAGARKMVGSEIDRLIYALERGGNFAAMVALHKDQAMPVLEAAKSGNLPLSSGIGTATVGVSRDGMEIARTEFGLNQVNDSDRNQHANWGWPMLDPKKWAEPIPMSGKQGLWNWPEPSDFEL